MKSILSFLVVVLGAASSFAQDPNYVSASEVNLRSSPAIVGVSRIPTLHYTMFTLETPCGVDSFKLTNAAVDQKNRVVRLTVLQVSSPYQDKGTISRDSISLPDRSLAPGSWLVVLVDSNAQELASFALDL